VIDWAPFCLSTSTWIEPDLPLIASISCCGVWIGCDKRPLSSKISTVLFDMFFVSSDKIAVVVLIRIFVVTIAVVLITWRQIGSVPTAGHTSATDANEWRGTNRWRLHARANNWLVEFPSSSISTKSAGVNVLWSSLSDGIGSRKAIE